jgi:hypothetical protein
MHQEQSLSTSQELFLLIFTCALPAPHGVSASKPWFQDTPHDPPVDRDTLLGVWLLVLLSDCSLLPLCSFLAPTASLVNHTWASVIVNLSTVVLLLLHLNQ